MTFFVHVVNITCKCCFWEHALSSEAYVIKVLGDLNLCKALGLCDEKQINFPYFLRNESEKDTTTAFLSTETNIHFSILFRIITKFSFNSDLIWDMFL